MSAVEAEVAAPRGRLGERLVDAGLISADQLKTALIEQQRSRKPLGETLVSLGFVTEETFREALSEKLGARSIQLSGIVADRAAMALIPKDLAHRQLLFPVSFDTERGALHVAASDPNDVIAVDHLRVEFAGRAAPVWHLAAAGEIQRTIELYYDYALSIVGILQEIETGSSLSEALAAQCSSFDPLLVGLVRTGELTGRLVDVLAEIVRSLKWQDELASRTSKAVRYPAFVAVVIFSVIGFLMVYLVPQLSIFLFGMGRELPLQTRALIAAS